MKKLLTVADHFQIHGRGVLVVPQVPVSTFPAPFEGSAELRRPDGTVRRAILALQYHFQTPPAREPTYAVVFKELRTSDIPIGTEVWLDTSW